ncbi:hypothetical protein C3408_18690 [Candidatus Pantoea alvi]|uniref:SDR family NAD(P)-dependent oxidoreductase n=1 Tax=Enterobacter agglomerans TaxID=549 RepID=UPI000CDD6F53|nr:3-oxoacyl-ACP reductase family protein [Pantoea agglomerans]POW55243.1 hypothetical protein C3408_18690 [Pantoea alvi]UBN52400.1 3-oxoacyl-ACP reductase FabG [Pantoea agglomerans]
MDEIRNKVALVTGASRGIGREAALALSRAGCRVVINYRHSSASAEALAEQIAQEGNTAIALAADVSRHDEVSQLISEIGERFGDVDILVNNAGINPVQNWKEISADDWNSVLLTNLSSSFFMSQAVLPAMQRNGWGRVIMMSSVAAQTGGVIGPHYAASKAGQIGLMHSYANLLAGCGITVNAVAPALIETDMIKNNDSIKPDLIPVGRFGQPDEVVDAIMMLVRNGYINGQTINVNGGWYMS